MGALATDHPVDSSACEHTQRPGAAPQPSYDPWSHFPASEGPAALLHQVMAIEASPGKGVVGAGRFTLPLFIF